MIQLNFNFENKTISTNVTKSIKDEGLVEYKVEINDNDIAKEFNSPIYFESKGDFFRYKDSHLKNLRATNFLFEFKRALDWLKNKQPDIDI